MNDRNIQDRQDILEPFRYFLGEWKGKGDGKNGFSQSERRFDLILNDNFIQVSNRSVYEPQKRNPSGEVHEDIGFLSYDQGREQYVMREFHNEGYVNQYVLETWDPEEGLMIMSTEAIENIPPGWHARTTYKIFSDYEFQETFDLAGPDADWTCYITSEFHREKGKG